MRKTTAVNVLLALVIFVVFSSLYLPTLTKVFWDSDFLDLAMEVDGRLKVSVQPLFHLIQIPMGQFFYNLLGLSRHPDSSIVLMEALSALLGALSLVVFFFLAQSFFKNRLFGLLSTLLLGVAYNFWRISTAPKLQMGGIALIMLAFMLARQVEEKKNFAAFFSGIFQGAALVFQLGNIIMLPSLLAMLVFRRAEIKTKSLYVLLFALGILAVFSPALIYWGGWSTVRSLPAIFNFFFLGAIRNEHAFSLYDSFTFAMMNSALISSGSVFSYSQSIFRFLVPFLMLLTGLILAFKSRKIAASGMGWDVMGLVVWFISYFIVFEGYAGAGFGVGILPPFILLLVLAVRSVLPEKAGAVLIALFILGILPANLGEAIAYSREPESILAVRHFKPFIGDKSLVYSGNLQATVFRYYGGCETSSVDPYITTGGRTTARSADMLKEEVESQLKTGRKVFLNYSASFAGTISFESKWKDNLSRPFRDYDDMKAFFLQSFRLVPVAEYSDMQIYRVLPLPAREGKFKR